MTTDELISAGLEAVEALRPAVTLLASFNPAAGAIASSALTVIYEGLVSIRAIEAHGAEAVRATLAAQVTDHLQTLAALKFESNG